MNKKLVSGTPWVERNWPRGTSETESICSKKWRHVTRAETGSFIRTDEAPTSTPSVVV